MEDHPPGPPPLEGGIRSIPWEEPGRPFLAALLETIRLFVTSPAEAFRRMPVGGDLFRPLVYAVLIGWAGAIVTSIYELFFSMTLWQFLPGLDETTNMLAETTGHFIGIFMAPFVILIALFIWSAVTHLLLTMLGGAGAGYQATLRVQCYAMTASIAEAIPIGGGLITCIWSLVLQIIGLAEIHTVTRGKAAMAVLLPFGLCCFCGMMGMMLAGVGVLSAILGNR